MEAYGIKGLFPNIEFQPEGYIGTMVTAEIGYALGQKKAVFYSEKSGRIELDALASGIISLDKLEEFRNL